jgi:hypothetical protein
VSRSLKRRVYQQGLLALGDCSRPVGVKNWVDLLMGSAWTKAWSLWQTKWERAWRRQGLIVHRIREKKKKKGLRRGSTHGIHLGQEGSCPPAFYCLGWKFLHSFNGNLNKKCSLFQQLGGQEHGGFGGPLLPRNAGSPGLGSALGTAWQPLVAGGRSSIRYFQGIWSETCS